MQLITALREILIWNTNGISNSNDKQSQLEVFHFINQGLTRSKRFYEIWQKNCASLPASQFRLVESPKLICLYFYILHLLIFLHSLRSIDFVILLLLIHIKEDRAFYIENIVSIFENIHMYLYVCLYLFSNKLRRRIKLEHITVDVLNETKLKFGAILELHTNTLMQILHNFLHDKHKNVADFSRNAYG